LATKKKNDGADRECAPGTVLFREGEAGDRMYVIKKGRVRLSKNVHDSEVVVEDLGPGEFCGEIALINDQARPVTATALTKATVIQIDASQFENMLKSESEIAIRMLKKISQRLTRAQFRISNMALRTTKARVLHQLRAEVYNSKGFAEHGINHAVSIPDNLPDVLSIEFGEIKTILSEFVRDELITVERNGSFRILDEGAVDRYLRYLELGDRFEFRS
jgi:CRP-like cAMP-binding protein